MLKRLLILICAGLLTIGCAVGTVNQPLQKRADDQSYPQMFTPDMESRKAQIERDEQVTFLGAYTPDGINWIMWLRDETTGKCQAMLLDVQMGVAELTCGQAYEIYRETCKKVGNCS
jgi:hypothetical protein